MLIILVIPTAEEPVRSTEHGSGQNELYTDIRTREQLQVVYPTVGITRDVRGTKSITKPLKELLLHKHQLLLFCTRIGPRGVIHARLISVSGLPTRYSRYSLLSICRAPEIV